MRWVREVGKVPCRRRGRRATGPGLGQTTVFLFVSFMLHMLDPYFPLFSNMFEMLDVGVLVRFSQMFPDVLYTCSNIPAIPASADRSEGVIT